MIIKPRIRGFICTTAHPVGCATLVERHAEWEKQRPQRTDGPRRALVIGGSGGYGLASRIVSAFGYGASTVCLSFEKEPEAEKTATAGYYNNAAFDRLARAHGLYAKSLNGDAFTDATKEVVAAAIESDIGQIDLLVYSLGAPVRIDPDTGVQYRSAIKPMGAPVHIKSINVDKGVVSEVDLAPATDEEIAATVKVMGGEDWERWIAHLRRRSLLSPQFRTVAYTYIGSKLTWPIYWEGTLGRAKEDLDRAAAALRETLRPGGGDARVAVLKAVVTQSSSAIPVVPLYMALLFKVMKANGTHEDCLRHIDRLFRDVLYGSNAAAHTDEKGRLRVDDLELREDIQTEIRRRWELVTSDKLGDFGDLDGYRADFLKIFGFGVDGVDYDADISPLV
jgi:enoyl-[acyl-carrier protein] reductase/trans-2-enoyl-CoA reductase (NAD+)